jgi:OmcA/MtrC family decaheme c-type cytochrome
MRAKRFVGFRAILIWAWALVALGLAACEGDDGPRGAAGPAGPPGPPPPVSIGNAGEINAAISNVTISSPPVVEFSLSDETGRPIIGLPQASISFAIARLVPGQNGDPSYWESYVTRVEDADGDAPDALASAIQASTESGANGSLQDNNDGTYVYTFDTDVANVAGITYDDTLTHRLTFEVRGFVPVRNPVYTFRPSDGATTGIFSREIVGAARCNVCHEELAIHGDGRFGVQNCVVCHNPGSTDQDSGNSVDFTQMIHKIHAGAVLPSVVAGGTYTIYGRFEGVHDYTLNQLPTDVRKCTICHDDGDPTLPEGGNYLTAPSREACGACHDDVDFETGIGHSDANLAAANVDCTLCHADGGFVGPVDESHALLALDAVDQFEFNILSITNTAPGDNPTVTFSITDPSNMDAPYDIQTDTPFTQGLGASRIAIDIGWDTTDFTNIDSGSATANAGTPAQPISLNPLFGGAMEIGTTNTFTMTSPTQIPLTASGTGIVAIEGHPAIDVDNDGSAERIPVPNASLIFGITDGAAVPRREIVDLAKCNNCHAPLSIHGNNRTDNIEVCATCHNANATDINRRMGAGVTAANAPDGKDEEPVNLTYMAHAIHAADEREGVGPVYYGFAIPPALPPAIDFSHVVYPGKITNCESCHLEDTYYEADADALATTIDTGADLSTAYDDINVTPTSAACAACHDTSLAQLHMEQNGGAWDVVQDASGALNSMSRGVVAESCAVCHGPGRIADVKTMHGF